MIDATAWIVAEAWIANGLRLRWGPRVDRFSSEDGWINDGNTTYRYAGFGEWEVRGGEYTNAGYPNPEAPSLRPDLMLHELAHWLSATDEQRGKRNFGLTGAAIADSEQEERTLLAERVLQSVVRSAGRIASLALSAPRGP